MRDMTTLTLRQGTSASLPVSEPAVARIRDVDSDAMVLERSESCDRMLMGQPRTYCDLPGYADLEAYGAEFEEQLHRDSRSFSLLPRETAASPRGRTREKSQKSSSFSRTFPRDWRTSSKGQSHGALAFMATHHGTGGKRGGKQSQKAKGKR